MSLVLNNRAQDSFRITTLKTELHHQKKLLVHKFLFMWEKKIIKIFTVYYRPLFEVTPFTLAKHLKYTSDEILVCGLLNHEIFNFKNAKPKNSI